MTSCEASGNSSGDHFAGAGKLIIGGKGADKSLMIIDNRNSKAVSPMNPSCEYVNIDIQYIT